MTTIMLSDEEIIEVEMIIMDKDKDGAFDFIREKILSKIKIQQSNKMKSHLEGGKGSLL